MKGQRKLTKTKSKDVEQVSFGTGRVDNIENRVTEEDFIKLHVNMCVVAVVVTLDSK